MPATPADGPTTTIGPTIIIRGKLKSDEDLVVEGRIDAEIASSKALMVENSGIVKANVQVKSARVSGVVVGNISAESKVELASDGRVVGDILSPKIVIRDGAAFRGRIDMPDFDEPRAAVPEPVAAAKMNPIIVEEQPFAAREPTDGFPDATPFPPEPRRDDTPAVQLAPLEPEVSVDNVFEDSFNGAPLPSAKPAIPADRDSRQFKRNKRF